MVPTSFCHNLTIYNYIQKNKKVNINGGEFMKKLKKILYLTTLCLVIFLIGYFVVSFINLNDKEISQEYFINQRFSALNSDDYIIFNNLENIFVLYKDKYYFIDSFEYSENIMIMTSKEEILYFIVIDENTIYSSTFNSYFYLM